MTFLIILLLIAGGVVLYLNRVKVLAKILGQPERRIAGHLERRKRR